MQYSANQQIFIETLTFDKKMTDHDIKINAGLLGHKSRRHDLETPSLSYLMLRDKSKAFFSS